MLTAYVNAPAHLSKAMLRVAAALHRHAPAGVQVVDREADADLVVLHVIGMEGLPEAIAKLKGRRYAIVQYCLASTRNTVADWVPIWDGADLVWSYYDLRKALVDVEGSDASCFLYLAPLGVDPAFNLDTINAVKKSYGVVTSGYVAGEQEAIDFCYDAAVIAGKRVFHLGPMPVGLATPSPAHWTSAHEITDAELANAYASAEHVSGLRWTEGFELPVIEGASCGARPICFDLPVYRRWFDGIATFVPHDRLTLGTALVDALRDPWPMTSVDAGAVRRAFAWAPIVRGFWERLV